VLQVSRFTELLESLAGPEPEPAADEPISYRPHPALQQPMIHVPDPANPTELIPAKRLTLIQKNEAKNFALEIITSNEYRESVRRRAKAGTLPPPVEQMLWHYAYGKPAETVKVEHTTSELEGMSPGELATRAAVLSEILRKLEPPAAADVAEGEVLQEKAS
jgi:hypothetical protein